MKVLILYCLGVVCLLAVPANGRSVKRRLAVQHPNNKNNNYNGKHQTVLRDGELAALANKVSASNELETTLKPPQATKLPTQGAKRPPRPNSKFLQFPDNRTEAPHTQSNKDLGLVENTTESPVPKLTNQSSSSGKKVPKKRLNSKLVDYVLRPLQPLPADKNGARNRNKVNNKNASLNSNKGAKNRQKQKIPNSKNSLTKNKNKFKKNNANRNNKKLNNSANKMIKNKNSSNRRKTSGLTKEYKNGNRNNKTGSNKNTQRPQKASQQRKKNQKNQGSKGN